MYYDVYLIIIFDIYFAFSISGGGAASLNFLFSAILGGPTSWQRPMSSSYSTDKTIGNYIIRKANNTWTLHKTSQASMPWVF